MGAGTVRKPIIEGHHVTKEYLGPTNADRALDGVDVPFYEGQITLLIGPSGCGKTTLLNIIAGFEQADRGRSPKMALRSGRTHAVASSSRIRICFPG